MSRDLSAHPAAQHFPVMEPARFEELVASIRSRGQQVPIVLCEGKILDGRHRYQACRIVGAEPRCVDYEGDPYAHVWDLNAARRDLEPPQRVAIKLLVNADSEAWRAEREAAKAAANASRSRATSAQPRQDGGRRLASGVLSGDKIPEASDHEWGHDRLAAEAGVSPATAARVQALHGKRPDLVEAIAAGRLKLTEAVRQVRREELIASPLPSSTYRVIYADPPWRYGDTRAGLSDYSASAAEDSYPTMSVSELSALDVRRLAADDAVLFCWATFPLLPDALEVVHAWGFKYKTAFVWSKKRPNFGHYHNASAELLLVATRGSGVPDADLREDQVQEIPRTGRHSEKPEEFRALIDRLYRRPEASTPDRIELFRRGAAPEGWAAWGNEVEL